MLKTPDGDRIVLITQPDHARLSGFLAARWGGGDFVAPGGYAPSSDPAALRDEVVFAVTQHDNGWWEWEADPRLSADDGLPAGLTEALDSFEEGADRWRRGVRRFAAERPYASLVMGRHPHRLYAWARRQADADHIHPIHHGKTPAATAEALAAGEALIEDLEAWEAELRGRILREGPDWAREAAADEQFLPHVRLVQALDAFSLALCSDVIPTVDGLQKGLGTGAVDLANIPRRGWDDRVTLRLRPTGERSLSVDPYPFGSAPLRVTVRARVVEPGVAYPFAGAGLTEETLAFDLHPA